MVTGCTALKGMEDRERAGRQRMVITVPPTIRAYTAQSSRLNGPGSRDGIRKGLECQPVRAH
jgi:hypothetical protein